MGAMCRVASVTFALLAAALLAALALAGCAGRASDVATARGLSAEETRWVARYANWHDALDEALRDEAKASVGVVDDPAGYRAATGWLRGCSRRFESQVGEGPTARTDQLAERLRAACRLYEGATTRIADAYATSDDPVSAIVDRADAFGRAQTAVALADDALSDFSLARRALPVRRSPFEGSHADPVLEEAAERGIEGFETEVRCWSEGEWPALIEEETALTNGQLTVDSAGAFANMATLQINMQESDCASLGRAASGGSWWPDDEDHRLQLSWALGVLAHEAQHIAGVANEAETECRGQQRIADVAVALGAPVNRARALAEQSWAELYPTIDPEYRTIVCRDGGPFDLRPGLADRWPWG